MGPPCEIDSNRTTLAVAAAAATFTVLTPHDRLADAASSESMVGMWRCGESELEMGFASGIHVLQDHNAIKDPGKAWQRLAHQDPDNTSVGTVQGQPAALIDPAKSHGGARGGVTVVLDGTWVVVVGDGQPSIDDLVRVADSLRPV